MDFIGLLHTQTGQLVACIRTNGGTEYHTKEFEAWLRKKGIRHETTIRHTPQQNGLAERDNRTLFEGARTLLASNRSLPLSLWAEATNHKAYVLNRSLSSTCPTMTPHEAWYGSKPDLSSLRTFGTEFYTLVPKQIRKGKLEDVGVLVYFVGNSETQKGERFYDPSTGKLNTSRDTTPVHYYYEPRLPSSDLKGDTEVFPDHEDDTLPGTDPITPPHHQAESDHEENGQANKIDQTSNPTPHLASPRRRRGVVPCAFATPRRRRVLSTLHLSPLHVTLTECQNRNATLACMPLFPPTLSIPCNWRRTPISIRTQWPAAKRRNGKPPRRENTIPSSRITHGSS